MMNKATGAWILMLSIGSAFAVGCGGGEKKVEEPTVPLIQQEEEEEYVDNEDEMIPEEKFVEIKSTFKRKSTTVARCYPKAMDAGEVDKDGTVKVTVGMVIQKDGWAKDIVIAATSKRSATLESCVITAIGRWQFTELPSELPYSFTFVLQNL